MRESFVMYRSFAKALNALPAENYVNIMKALTSYALDDTEPTGLNEIETAFFDLMKPQVDACNSRYSKNVDNGKLGGRPKTQNNPEVTQNNPEVTQNNPEVTQPKPNGNLNDNDNDNENENVNKNENINGGGSGNGVVYQGEPQKNEKNPTTTTAVSIFETPYNPNAPPFQDYWEQIRKCWNKKPGVVTCEYFWISIPHFKRQDLKGIIGTYGADKICAAIDAHFSDPQAIKGGWLSKKIYNFLEKQLESYVEA